MKSERVPYPVTPVNGYVLLTKIGGDWLSTVREHMQRTPGGEYLTWGSTTDVVREQFTVRDLEELAAFVAAAAINEYAKNPEQFNRRYLQVVDPDKASDIARQDLMRQLQGERNAS